MSTHKYQGLLCSHKNSPWLPGSPANLERRKGCWESDAGPSHGFCIRAPGLHGFASWALRDPPWDAQCPPGLPRLREWVRCASSLCVLWLLCPLECPGQATCKLSVPTVRPGGPVLPWGLCAGGGISSQSPPRQELGNTDILSGAL